MCGRIGWYDPAKLDIREPARMVANQEKTQPTGAVTVTG
jgi:hypothetical protein